MTVRPTRMLAIALLAAAELALGTAPPVHAMPTCRLTFIPQAKQVCFSPADAAVAERSSRLPAINPTSAVAALLRLQLQQVVVTTATSPGLGKQIHFLYGRIPGGQTEINGAVPFGPRFVTVEEVGGSIVPLKPSFYAQRKPLWGFTGYVATRNLSILILSNGPRRAVKQLGYVLLDAGARGKL